MTRSMLRVIIMLKHPRSAQICSCPWSHCVFQDVFVHISVHGFNNSLQWTHGSVGEASPNHHRSTSMFYRRTLVPRSISGANRTSNPLNTIRTEQLELRFVAPDVISPLSRSPGQVLFSPFNASFPVFRLTSGFLTGLHPCSPATCRRLLIVLLDGPGSFGDVTET
uniref:Uncharacterized protein n=1 Tax=Caenorhabditis japonica TaxID=281687 RepID=A0A8R1EPH5_CAEJA